MSSKCHYRWSIDLYYYSSIQSFIKVIIIFAYPSISAISADKSSTMNFYSSNPHSPSSKKKSFFCLYSSISPSSFPLILEMYSSSLSCYLFSSLILIAVERNPSAWVFWVHCRFITRMDANDSKEDLLS